ncbi:MAG: rare lipoprotein A (peptidoglycan hydrolase)/cell division protein FtsN [Neolewinella sp.]|jgi:rare lipoprotein A (peptidoglycan hydrolase)
MTNNIYRLLLSGLLLALISPLSAQRMEGMASFYGHGFDGKSTSTGETFHEDGYSAASKELDWGTVVEVTNLSNGKKVQVRINDCGPHAKNRLIDLSQQAAKDLDFIKQGETKVSLRIVRASNSGPNCGRGAWSKKLKAAGKPIPPKPGPWKPSDTAGMTTTAPGGNVVPPAPTVNPTPAQVVATPPIVAPFPVSRNSVRSMASYYAERFHGRPTSTGETYDRNQFTAASKAYPYNTLLEVTNVASGQKVNVRVNDCGPNDPKRIVDLSYAAANQIGLLRAGVASVDVRVVKMGVDGPTCNRSKMPTISGTIAVQAPVVPTPDPVDEMVKAYNIQLGAFGNESSAYELYDKAVTDGYVDAHVFINLRTGLYTTILRTFYDKTTANKVKSQLLKDGFKKMSFKETLVFPVNMKTVPSSKEEDVDQLVDGGLVTYGSDVQIPDGTTVKGAPQAHMVTGYRIQLGAFKTEGNANTVRTSVTDKNYVDAAVVFNPATKFYATVLSTFYDKVTGKKVQAQLAKDGFTKTSLKEEQTGMVLTTIPSSKGELQVAKGEAPKTYGSEIQVPKPAKKTFEPDAILFGVQVGSYSSAESVQKAKAKLDDAGIDEVYEAKVGKITRVFAGKFYFPDQANSLKKELRDKGFDGAIVRRVQ